MSAVEILAFAGRLALVGIGGYIVVLNWASVVLRRSWTPLVGGILLAAFAYSVPALRAYWYFAFLVDFGSGPGMIWAVANLIRAWWNGKGASEG